MKSLISKFTTLFVLSVALVFLLLSFGLNKALEEYFIKEKMDTLLKHGEEVQRAYLEESIFVTLKEKELLKEIKTLSYYFDETIWLIDQRGYVYVSKEDVSIEVIKNAIDPGEINSIMSGQSILKESDDSTFFNKPVLTLGRPILNEKDEVVFALYIHVEVPEVLETRAGVFTIIGFAFFFGVTLVALIVYLASRRMSKDLKGLNQRVKALASGESHVSLKTKRKDEIGQLTMNTEIMANHLKDTEEERRRFISDISHDFRSPLSNIIGFSKGLLDGTIEHQDQEKYLSIILKESGRLLNLSNDMLMLSKLQQPLAKIEMIKLDIESILLNVLDTFETQIEKEEVAIDLSFNLGNTKALGDEKLIRRAIHNLIHNGLKFNVNKGFLSIETKADEKNIWVIISNQTNEEKVNDTTQLFKRFYKGDLSRGIEKSSGLGLAIVKEIFDRHGSVVNLESHDHVFKVVLNLDRFS